MEKERKEKELDSEIEALELKIRELEEELDDEPTPETICPSCGRKAELDVNGFCFQC